MSENPDNPVLVPHPIREDDVDSLVAQFWAVENACEDADGVTFHATSDQWWGVWAYCPHVGWDRGVYAVSNGGLDLSTGFRSLLTLFRGAHRDVAKAP